MKNVLKVVVLIIPVASILFSTNEEEKKQPSVVEIVVEKELTKNPIEVEDSDRSYIKERKAVYKNLVRKAQDRIKEKRKLKERFAALEESQDRFNKVSTYVSSEKNKLLEGTTPRDWKHFSEETLAKIYDLNEKELEAFQLFQNKFDRLKEIL